MQKSLVLEKAIKFALRIVKLYHYLIEEKREFVISKQLLLSGMLVGKFIKSANKAESTQVFIYDMQTALKKASETEYWLLILHEGKFLEDKEYNSINEDCIELLKILTAIVKTSKKMSELIKLKENSILTLTLNRPEKRNALNDSLINALKNALREADIDEELRTIIINGAGKDFCSGADLAALEKIAESDVLENLFDAESLAELFLLMRKVKIPVIAAVHGRALAGGCGLATACDIVLASKNAQFGYPEVKIGFVPAMVMAILRRNLSEKRIFELITKGFSFNAETAERMGLINHVFADETFEKDVAEFVEDYKNVSRSAVILSKKLLYQMDGMNFDTALQTGAEVNAIARLTDDCQNGIAKFLKK